MINFYLVSKGFCGVLYLIENISVEEFRGIKRLLRPLELGAFNIIVGRNDSGKSAVLEALYLFPDPEEIDPLFGSTKIAVLERIYTQRRFLIYGYWGSATLEYRVGNYEFSLTLSLESIKKEVLESSSEGVRGLHLLDVGYDEYHAALKQEEIDPKKFSILIKSSDLFVELSENYVYSSWDAAVKEGLNVSIVNQIINPSVDEKYTELLKYEGDLRLRKTVDDKILYIRLRDLGSGVYRAIVFCSAIALLNPRLVLWDDFETSLHHSLNAKILRWLSDRDQVVITTQSIDTLVAAYEADIEDLRVILLRRLKNDIIDYKVIHKDELEDLLESNVDPRKLVDLVGVR